MKSHKKIVGEGKRLNRAATNYSQSYLFESLWAFLLSNCLNNTANILKHYPFKIKPEEKEERAGELGYIDNKNVDNKNVKNIIS